tara:strand:+ start:43009 stop:43998 length:990 start_codon:yes stop_codon:yes gene_type:complete
LKYNFDLKNKKILVTGGAGFIGSNLCEYLVSKGAYIRCLDNLSTGNKENIEHLIDKPNFEFIKGDIRDINTCKSACIDFEYVLHQAALGSVPRSIKDPSTTNEVNISGFLNMLIASRDNNIKRFIFAASSSTYGDSKLLPKLEENIGEQLSPYAITKYVNELYASNFSKLYSLDFIGLRYFNVFGRRQNPSGPYAAVIPKFIKLLMDNISPTIYGDGTFSRDFTYIDNVILMNVLSICTTKKTAINKIYNTAVGSQTTINDLAILLKKYLSKYDAKINEIKLNYSDQREGDIPHSLASIQKAKEYLNYNPTHSLELGIKDSIDWYWNNI